ncbi:unnamed protein product, partial [Didymodactylos carnosus]
MNESRNVFQVLESKISKINYKSSDKYDQDYFKNYGLKNVDIRSYQLHGIKWLIERYEADHGCILSDEMGLGKTLQTIVFLLYVSKIRKRSPSIVICPLSVIQNWTRELKTFVPDLIVHVFMGTKEERQKLAENIKQSTFDILLTTYELVIKDPHFFGSFKWHVLVIDEAHRIKNAQSLLHTTLADLSVPFNVLLTGTPIQNNLSELYSLLSFCASKVFQPRHHDDFVKYFNLSAEENSQKLIDLLKPFILRRLKSNVLKDLPNKIELILYHDLSKIQKDLYKALLTKNRSIFGDNESASKTRLVNILMQLRKCIGHPYLFPGIEPEPFEIGEHLIEASGKLSLLDLLLNHLFKNGHKVLLFSQFTGSLDVIQDYLAYRDYTYERLDGSVRSEERFLAVNNFNKNEDTFIFLLSTKAGGVGLNLTAADTVIFYDSDFNPQNDLQAADRAHRIGQTRPVRILRLICRNSFEEVILRRAELKLKLSKTIMENNELASSLNTIIDTNTHLTDALKIGIDKLLDETNQMDYKTVDFNKLIGKTDHKGRWLDLEVENEEKKEPIVENVNEIGDDLYLFEGVDYRRHITGDDDDQKVFNSLINININENDDTATSSSRRTTASSSTQRQRRQLTDEEKEARKKKMLETKARNQRQLEEAALERAQRKRENLKEKWKNNNYHSCRISISDTEDESENKNEFYPTTTLDDDEEPVDEQNKQLNYVIGDLMKPKIGDEKNALIVHCVDDSGRWSSGGVFGSISKRSLEPEKQYILASKMHDLSLGDVHIIKLDDCGGDSEDEDDNQKQCDLYVALIVAQHRSHNGELSGIKLHALDMALKALSTKAKQLKASVHLPRIGYATQGFNWYGTEKLIKKYLSSQKIPSYVYYFKRQQTTTSKRSFNETKSEEEKHKSKTDSDGFYDGEISCCSLSVLIMFILSVFFRFAEETDEDEEPPRTKLKINLPHYFSDIHIYFHDVDQQVIERLQRFIIAFDGNIDEQIDEKKTTHIITYGDCKHDLQALQDACPTAKIASIEWLEECINKGQMVEIDFYKI